MFVCGDTDSDEPPIGALAININDLQPDEVYISSSLGVLRGDSSPKISI